MVEDVEPIFFKVKRLPNGNFFSTATSTKAKTKRSDRLLERKIEGLIFFGVKSEATDELF